MKEFKILSKNNNNLHVYFKEKSNKDLFILFHGMFGSNDTDSMIQTREYLLQKNYSVITFDYTGHGKSQGNNSDVRISQIIHDKNLIVNHVKKQFKNIYLLGFSFGAILAIHEASINNSVKGIILFNPVTNILKLIFRNKTQNDLDNYVKKHRHVDIITKFKFLVDALKYNLYNDAKKIICPVYVYHIKNDNSVPVKQSHKLNNFITSKKRFIYPYGSDHGLTKEVQDGSFKKKILPDAVNWIKSLN